MEPSLDIQRFFRSLGEGRFEEIEPHLDENVVLEFPGRRFGVRVEGRRRVMVFLKRNQRLFDGGLRFTVAWAGGCGDRVVAQWTNAGRTREGRDYENRGCSVFTLAGGRVVRIEDYLDTERIAETWPEEGR